MVSPLLPAFTDTFIDDLLAQMKQLGSRPYAEIGVPMFLVTEDLTTSPSVAPSGPGKTRDLAALFAGMAEALASRTPDLTADHIAQLVELLADRYFLEFTTPPFSAMGTLHPEPA